jgi:hypothetical protein
VVEVRVRVDPDEADNTIAQMQGGLNDHVASHGVADQDHLPELEPVHN